MSACRSCKAEIVWAATVNKKLIPLDAQPVPDGNVTLTTTSPIVATVLGPLELQLLDVGTPRYMPHHATCPDAEGWRRT